MSTFWHPIFHTFLAHLYFDKVTVVGAGHVPASGPLLLLGLHRNGAVDGFVYHSIVRRIEFMISVQLRKSLVGRVFFNGLEVARERDLSDAAESKAVNTRGLAQCVEHLRKNGCLCVFPEGTSSLGPRHLPFKSGAAHLALEILESSDGSLPIVPVGIHYEAPGEFRSRVEVVFGPPVSTEMPAEWSRAVKLRELKRRFESALEQVGVNVVSDEYQSTIQPLAYIATLGTRRSYFKSLKQLEHAIPTPLETGWRQLSADFVRPGLLFHQGVPLCPIFPLFVMFIVLVLIGPITLAGWLLNAPPLLAGAWAGQRFADGPNVVSLWRLLVGAPVFVAWVALLTVVLILSGHPAWLACYALITLATLKLTRLTRKVIIEINNGLRHRDLRGRALHFHQQLLSTLPDETI
ncbi:1-acyl-sn-glycerol-3-phosphate acyltransferase [Prosthecobacter sp.]|uniref:1-acyl-sn-glycerol-3-phosphate acyltransferase n=1 Tax=Prosthecobacter sp. TaxID=1965333 RepID=UPI0037838967